jgi:hypothetical protein
MEQKEPGTPGQPPTEDLSGEDLSRGPTPETRHPDGSETGGDDDIRDTTQGPTPETRQVMRATDDDPAAAGQPDADLRTRADIGGNQDLEDTGAVGAGARPAAVTGTEAAEAGPHYGEPAKDDPHYGEGGEEKPDASEEERAEALRQAKERARESGEEASKKTGGESGGMASAY